MQELIDDYEEDNKEWILDKNKYNIITYEELNNLYKQYCKNLDNEYNVNNKLIINKLLNKLNFIHNIKCINCNKLLEILSNNILNNYLNDITNDKYIKNFNICKNCE